MNYTAQDVSKLGTILGLWAHPDDEVFASGGLIHAAKQNGQLVILITATEGSAGETSDEKIWPQSELGKIRRKELEDSLKILGSPEHYWLDCPDGELKSQNVSECTKKVLDAIGDRKIDTVITFEKTGITGHPDHIAVHNWANNVADELGVDRVLYATENQEFYNAYGRMLDKQFNVYFNVKKPVVIAGDKADICLKLSDKQSSTKISALKAHKSQTSGLMNTDLGRKAMLEMCRRECFMKRVQ